MYPVHYIKEFDDGVWKLWLCFARDNIICSGTLEECEAAFYALDAFCKPAIATILYMDGRMVNIEQEWK